MDMRDKELDRLFQQKLNDLEIKPSARVWQGIGAELNTDKRRRILLPLLSAAAGIILLITAGILFIPKQPVKHNNQRNSTEIAKTHEPVKQPVAVKTEPVVPPAPAQNKVTANPVIVPVNSIAHVNKTKPNLTPFIQQPVVTAQPPAAAHADEPLLASAPAVDYNVTKTDAPDTATRISPKSTIINSEKNQPVLIAQTPAQSAPATARPAKKHRIRSLGDVFNVVIAAVDKRKDKVIEFSNTDEDDATITGLNLGFIKVKKDKDK